ncbi:hypothetical protein [Kriegella aquimaris]|uniref:Uncharacterized protein n=1 Tax=Kriegella aquimaris TaxID=192904 RepID=A0A1G9X8C9_9FLAO|nr:hypothetical protein [Kriegella aquimaris]SDM93020.1 hypothetical protein SAMN04488514_11756 [Kriegella aquimaris]
MAKFIFWVFRGGILIIFWCNVTWAQDLPESLPEIKYHLTSPDWKPLETPKEAYLEAVKGMVDVAYRFQEGSGAIIDPFLHREHQYSTPYYAFAVAALVDSGYAPEMLSSGVLAMEKALTDFFNGNDSIPDRHGEFYIAALAEAMELYKDHIPKKKYQQWVEMIATPLDSIWDGMSSHLNNWRTYAMKGEWVRAKHGFIDKQKTVGFIEDNWKNYGQYQRIGVTKWNLYEDWSSDPQSLAVEAVGRGNLTSMALAYDGPSAEHLKKIVRRGGATSMLLMSPAGQCPPNGRTDNHVFNDILYQLIFEVLAEDALRLNQTELAGQYRRSALLAFQSIGRWKRFNSPWSGSYSIAKNHFDLKKRTGYQPASQWGNYSGAMMFHLAEAFLTHDSEIKEVPAPTEIGGYAIQTGNRFSTFTANAGGMQVFINLRGASVPKYDEFWTPLGGVRFSKMGWDDRLGPSDGKRINVSDDPVLNSKGLGNPADAIFPQTGLTFGPTWEQDGKWVRIADMATHYQGTVTTEFVHPLLVKFKITYASITGRGGPQFEQRFVVTPDGVMTYLSTTQNTPFGLTVPLLTNDGRPLQTQINSEIASTGYTQSGDTQNFIGLNKSMDVSQDGDAIESTYGSLLPVKFRSNDEQTIVFVYPKSMDAPNAVEVKKSFLLTENGFSSLLGEVEGTLYVGKKTAGGYGQSLDIDQDGTSELVLKKECGFVAQLENDKIITIETDSDVIASVNNKTFELMAYQPMNIK